MSSPAKTLTGFFFPAEKKLMKLLWKRPENYRYESRKIFFPFNPFFLILKIFFLAPVSQGLRFDQASQSNFLKYNKKEPMIVKKKKINLWVLMG